MNQYPFEAAQVFVVDPNNLVLFARRLAGGADPNLKGTHTQASLR